MAKQIDMNCTCGAAYDSKGICTRCGKHRPRSTGYRILHTVLCILGTLLLLTVTARTLMMHDFLKDNTVRDGMRQSRISDTQIPFYGTVKKAIYSGTNDPNIHEEDIAEAIDAIGIPQILAGKIEQHFAMLRGDSKQPMKIAADEIIKPLEENRESLHQKCHLIIEDSDLNRIRDAFGKDGELEANFFGLPIYGNALGRGIGRFFVSIPGFLFELVLGGLLLWRWMKIKQNCGKDKLTALRAMGLTILIPMAFCLFCLTVLAISNLFVKGEYTGLKPLLKAVRPVVWVNTAMLFSAGLLMIAAGRYLRIRNEKKALAGAAPAAAPKKAEMPAVSLPAPAASAAPAPAAARTAAPVQPAAQPKSDSAKPADNKDICIACGKPLSGKKKFCIYCGTNQQTGKNAIDEILEAPDPVLPDAADDKPAGPQ